MCPRRKTLELTSPAPSPGTHISTPLLLRPKGTWTLKRTCPLFNDVSARRSLYLALVKSQLSYATPVWSPDKIALKTQIERVQRRATRWILKQRVGVMSYRDRLLTLKLLPLTFDRELKDLVFFYKCLNGFTDLNVSDFVSFVSCHPQFLASFKFNRVFNYYGRCLASRSHLPFAHSLRAGSHLGAHARAAKSEFKSEVIL